MKKIPPPAIDDFDILKKLCSKTNIKCQPHLSSQYFIMQSQYSIYINNQGNPWVCISPEIDDALKDALEYHYKKPLKLLKYIKEIRDTGSPDVCPMCGSLKTSTLDHYLPQSTNPEWIIFSKNLVPSCDCNSKRSTHTKGINGIDRVLHPYFDQCLNYRIVSCRISIAQEIPTISIIPIYHHSVSNGILDFHIENVLKRSTLLDWLDRKLANTLRKPRLIISNIPKNNLITDLELLSYIEELLEINDNEFETPNNWYSILFHGLLNNSDLCAHIVQIHNDLVLSGHS